jgi:hypothetical protein
MKSMLPNNLAYQFLLVFVEIIVVGHLKPYCFRELVGIALAFGIAIFLDKHFGR